MSKIIESQVQHHEPNLFVSQPLGRLIILSAILGAVALIAVSAKAQSIATASRPSVTPKAELFLGYSYFYPNATASGYLPNGIVPVSSCLCAIPDGGGAGITYDFNRWIGLTVDASAHVGGKGNTNATRIGNADAYNLDIGPQFKLRHRHFEPFAEVLFGEDRLAPSAFHQDTSFGMLAGGGLDLPIWRHVAIRAVQADFVYANHHFGPSPAVPVTNVRGLRLQAGVVFRFGGHAPAPIPIAPAPAPMMAVAPVVVAAPVDEVSITATAMPADMLVGGTSTISAQGVSSLGRPLTYSYSSSMGIVQGTGTNAKLSTAGVGEGTVIVTAMVVDDQGQSASTRIPVILHAAPIAAVVTTAPLCTLTFDRDLRRPTRVNNEGKACLDDIAMSLTRNSDARLALIGSVAASEAGAGEHRHRIAAERADHVREYLVNEKGIDATRIDIYTADRDGKSVTTVLVPAGATLDTSGLTMVHPH